MVSLVATDKKPPQTNNKTQPTPKSQAKDNCNTDSTLNSLAECLDKLYPGAQPAFFKKSDFPQYFVFGSATAAFQIEGGLEKHCRGDTTWDKFANEHGLFEPYGPDAVNHVENFEEDVKLMKDIGFDSYRFSISWSRILPCGRGMKSQEGIKFYKNLLETLKKNCIEPFITLFHWDLPLDLQDKYHGFLSQEIVEDFGNYAKICFEEFGDYVNYWITMNEPYSYAFLGHVNNVHAPAYGTVTDQFYSTTTTTTTTTTTESVTIRGCRVPNYRPPAVDCLKTKEKVTVFCPPCTEKFPDPFAFPYIVTHNMLLAHGQAVKEFRKYQSCNKGRADKKIGITLVSMWFEPRNPECGHDKAAARRALDFFLGWYLNPMVHGEYPESMQQYVKTGHLPNMTEADRELIKGSYDFIGINYYTARYVAHKVSKEKHLKDGRNYITDQHLKYYETRVFKNGKEAVPIGEKGSSAWLISHPQGIEKLLLHIKKKYKDPVIYITENGLDDEDDGCTKQMSSLGDQKRMIYIRDHLKYVLCALKKGVKVKGYFAWSLLDNFEWDSGFKVRFGLVYVDYKDGSKRYPKLSAQWFKHFLCAPQTKTEKPIVDPPSPTEKTIVDPPSPTEKPIVDPSKPDVETKVEEPKEHVEDPESDHDGEVPPPRKEKPVVPPPPPPPPMRIVPRLELPPPETIVDYEIPSPPGARVRQPARDMTDEFEKAIRIMKGLPDDNPWSLVQQANIYSGYLDKVYSKPGYLDAGLDVHDSWLFFPFHRWYCYFFEKICGKLLGNPDFALPFWNWDFTGEMLIPPWYSNSDSSLSDPLRNPAHGSATVLDLDYNDTVDPDSGSNWNRAVNRNMRIVYRQMGRLFFTGFGLETAPINTLYRWTGDRTKPNGEKMGNLYSAANDPIFFAHLSNLDRLWSEWQSGKIGAGKTWQGNVDRAKDAAFLFYDENKRMVRVRVKDCLDLAKLGYTYEVDQSSNGEEWLDSPPTPRVSSEVRRVAMAKALSRVGIDRQSFPVKLDKAVTLALSWQHVKNRTASEKDLNDEVLVLEDIVTQRGRYVKFDIYINDEGESSPENTEFAWSFVHVPHVSYELPNVDEDGREKTYKTDLRVSLTGVLDDLEAEKDNYVLVTLVPRVGCGDTTVGGIKIQFERTDVINA